MLPVTFNKKTQLAMPALLCVLAVFFFTKASLPYFAGEYFSGILAVYTMYPFYIFGVVGHVVYMLALFTVLYKIGNRARSGYVGRYISYYVIFMLCLDLLVYQLTGNNGITVVSLILAQSFDQYALVPLLLLIVAVAGIVATKPAMKSLSAIFGATFILINTLIFNQ